MAARSTEAKHAPGPWRIGDNPFDVVSSTHDDEYVVVATVAHDRQGLNRGREASLANARLIAEAPALLATLKNLVTRFYHDSAALLTAQDVANLLSAIAKAEGAEWVPELVKRDE